MGNSIDYSYCRGDGNVDEFVGEEEMKTEWTEKKLDEFEERVAQEFIEGKISCPIHLSGGNASELRSIFELINPCDWVISTHRNHFHYLLKGGSGEKLLDELYGKPTGVCGGYGRSMHIFDDKINFISTAIVGGGAAIGCGIALAIAKEFPDSTKPRPHVWCFVGDGAEDSGHFIEGVRFADARKLPITFIIEDNDLSIDVSKEERWKCWQGVSCTNIVRYNYKRRYPHVGVGKHVNF